MWLTDYVSQRKTLHLDLKAADLLAAATTAIVLNGTSSNHWRFTHSGMDNDTHMIDPLLRRAIAQTEDRPSTPPSHEGSEYGGWIDTNMDNQPEQDNCEAGSSSETAPTSNKRPRLGDNTNTRGAGGGGTLAPLNTPSRRQYAQNLASLKKLDN
ncbi:hypothetical protein FRC06_003925, partial [Ceratobasidium sp. 370]